MGRGCVLLLALANCNWALGLTGTQLQPDGALLLVPPDGTTACGSPPSFETWHYTPHVVLGATFVLHPTFLTPERIVFMSQAHLFESSVDGGDVRRLTELELYVGEGLAFPSAGPGGNLIWFVRLDGTDAGIWYATRDADGWHQQRADLGVIADQVQPGSAGFYGGTARMVVAVQPTNTAHAYLVELASADGVHWSPLDTVPPFGDGSADTFDPALSVDGCFVLFTTYGATDELYVAARSADGAFMPAAPVDDASMQVSGVQPAIDPSLHKLWINENGAGLVEATP